MLTEFWLEAQKGEVLPSGRSTVADYMDRWLDSHGKKVRVTTLRGYEQAVKAIHQARDRTRRARQAEGNTGRRDVRSAPRPWPISHDRCQLHRALSKALKQAVDLEVIPRNPCERVKPPSKASVDYVVLRPEHLRQTLGEVKGTAWEPFFRLAIFTGMRRSEMFGLRWDDVDLEERQVTVRRALNYVPRSGRVDDGTKTRKIRTIPIDDETVKILRERRLRQKEERLRAGPAWQDWGTVFTRPDGRPVSPTTLAKFWQTLRVRLQLPKRARFHDLRHAHATHLVAMGTDLKTVQDRMGHATARFTLDVYSRALPELAGRPRTGSPTS
jgi:integrase